MSVSSDQYGELKVGEQGFFRNHIVQWLFAFGVLGNIILWSVCAWFFSDRFIAVSMRYNVYLGIDSRSTGPWYAPYGIPLVLLVFFIVSIGMARRFFVHQDRVLAHIILFGSAIMQLYGLVGLTALILVNR